MHNFTPEDLVQFLYQESTTEQAAAIEKALHQNWALREKLALLSEGIAELKNVQLQSPRSEAIQAILNYATAKETVAH
jgi:hypothetical protein